jgi:hypothetical protein
MPLSLTKMAIMISVNSFTMQVVITKTALISIFVGEFENANAVLHAAAPISFVLSPREEVIATVSVDFIIDETARVLLSRLVLIVSPTFLLVLFHLALVHVAISVFYAEPLVSEVFLLDLFILVLYFLRVVCILLMFRRHWLQ